MKMKAQLSESSLEQLIQQIEQYKEKVDLLPQKLVQSLTGKAKKYIEQNLASITDTDGNIDVYTGKENLGNVGRAFLGGSQARFLEFGTGIAGGASSHPLAIDVGWQYNNQDREGSKIYQAEDGRIGWVYFDRSTRQFRFSEGIAAQMTVYRAAQQVRRETVKTAKELMK